MGIFVAVASQGFAIGHPGTDAPFIWIGPDGKPHRVGGWGQQAMAEVGAALATLNAASQIPDRAMQGQVFDVVQAMLKPHMAYLEKAGQPKRVSAQ